MLRLGLCTVTKLMSLAVMDDRHLLAELMIERDKVDDLVVLVDRILSDAKVALEDINELVVVRGPGSYSGIRSSLTFVKTMAMVRKLPIKVVNTVELMAYNMRHYSGLILVAMESRKGEINFGMYGGGAEQLNPLIECETMTKAMFCSRASMIEREYKVVGDLVEIPHEIEKYYESVTLRASDAIRMAGTRPASPDKEVLPLYAYGVTVTTPKKKVSA